MRFAQLIDAHPAVHLAVGSHNARAHARAEALAEAAGLPPSAVEHQTLFRTAEGTSRALAEVGWVARDYVPVGELAAGDGLPRAARPRELVAGRGAAPEPRRGRPRRAAAAATGAGAVAGRPAARRRSVPAHAGGARWFEAEFRDAFEVALASTRARWGEHFPLRAGDEELAASEELTVHSPSHPDAEPVGHGALADAAGARRAVAVARSGAPRWARTPVAERAAILRRAAQLLEERGHEFAAWVVHEGGRDRADAWAEVEEAIGYLRYYAAEAEALFEGFGDRVAHRGVVAVIPPWNFSIAIPCGMTVAALACGNAAILKPAEQTPLIGQRLVALLHEAGVPRDALIALPGRGETAGAALAESSEVDMVAFTGSRAVGTYLHEAVAMADLTGPAEIKSLVAELGGKNAVLVFADADPDEVVEAVMASSFSHANQKCSAASRILVAEPIFEALRDRLVDAARSLRVGPADAPGTRINPLIDRKAHERLRRDADTARAECEVLLDTFETPADDLTAGPLIVQLPADRALEARTTTEELFGPIVALIPFRTAAEAYAVTNGTAYGLTAGVFSRSPLTIAEATRALQVGNVYVNRRTTGARVGVEPFGGMRMSGTGPKAGGLDYLWAFVRRTDAPPDDDAERAAAEAEAPSLPPPLDLPDRGWDAPLEQRLAAVESAAVLLGERGEHATADALLATAQAARRELGTAAAHGACGRATHGAALRHASRARPPLRAGRRRPMVARRRAARRQRRRALRLAGARPGRGGAARGGRARRGAARRRGRYRGDAQPRAPAGDRVRRDRRRAGARARALPSARSDAARPTLAQGVAIDARRSASGRAGLPPPLRLAEGRRRAHPAPRGRPGAGRGGPLTIEDGPAPVAAGTGHG